MCSTDESLHGKNMADTMSRGAGCARTASGSTSGPDSAGRGDGSRKRTRPNRAIRSKLASLSLGVFDLCAERPSTWRGHNITSDKLRLDLLALGRFSTPVPSDVAGAQIAWLWFQTCPLFFP